MINTKLVNIGRKEFQSEHGERKNEWGQREGGKKGGQYRLRNGLDLNKGRTGFGSKLDSAGF